MLVTGIEVMSFDLLLVSFHHVLQVEDLRGEDYNIIPCGRLHFHLL